MNHSIATYCRLAGLTGVLAIACSAQAQTAASMPAPMSAVPMAAKAPTVHRMLASKMIGEKVVGAAGKKVGEVQDLIVDISTGQIRYALLEFDPGFFKSEKLYAVPVTALGLTGSDGTLTYREVSRDQLTRAAVGKTDAMRAVDNRRYVEGLDKNYGFKPPAGTAYSMRATKVIGRDVDSRAGKGIGKIKDLVVDMQAGSVRYAVLSFDPSWFSGAKLFAFPLTTFKTEADKDDLVLDVDKNMLASMKNFDADKWGSLNDLNRDDFVNAAPPAATTK